MTQTEAPQVILIAGPNGAGKSTCSPVLLTDSIAFVNADEIARTLPDFPSPSADMQAGRLLLQRLDELGRQGADFAVETTLASRSLAPRIKRLKAAGYRFHLIFLWIPSADLSVARVAERVRRGGHHIPEETIRRRYKAGLRNFLTLYQPVADTWGIYRNVRLNQPELIAKGVAGEQILIILPDVWNEIVRQASDEQT